ncbi:rho-associated protein kinase 2-like [Mercenaria mercenaria]|uniref:rho-associated protein kinase 2-like n=1 Tax=Mercenaria mercenaria TaxID=6596 RepID=UPI00234F4A8B|nr:rho-associated protein kinase 2-like [Mercenaria mercenaria]
MDVKQIRSVLLCVTCIFLMPGNAIEFSTDVLYEIFSRRMDDVMLEHKLLRLEFDEAVRNMGNQADRITNIEDATNKIEKQADKMANFEEAIAKIEEQAIKISSVEETAKRMEKQADKTASFEEAINKIEEQAVKISSLEETTKTLEMKADKISNLEAALNKFEEQGDKIANLEESTERIEKQTERITSLEEAINKIKEQADKIVHLEEVTKKMEKQVDRITKLEDCVKKIENKNKEVTYIENAVQHLNNKIEELKNNTLNNEKAISNVTRLVTENDMKAIKASESSINAIKDNVTKQSVAVRKFVSAEKMFLREIKKSLHKKFSNFTNEVTLRLSTLNASVESQVSSFKTILNVSEKTVSVALNDYSIYMNDTFSNFNQEILTFVNETERKLETLQDEIDKKSTHHNKTLNKADREIQQLKTRTENVETGQETLKETTAIHTKTLNTNNGTIQQLKARIGNVQSRQETLQEKVDEISIHHTNTLKTTNGEIQQLETRMMNVETRQGKRAAFTVDGASRQSNGILKFSTVRLNEGSVYDTTTGKFTSPYAGIYGFTASIIELGIGDNRIDCRVRKNGYGYVVIYSWRGKIDGRRATAGLGTATAAVTLHLVKGDSVDVWCSSRTGTALSWSSFTGFLINPDP